VGDKESPLQPQRPVGGKPTPEALARLDRRWRPRYLMLAPYRLGFFLAMVLLVASGAWWALVQAAQAGLLPALPAALPPSVAHAAAMVYGVMPLFFAGFLFTAAPKWLRVEPPPLAALRPALLLQALGWLLWLAGALASTTLALGGVLLAAAGLTWMLAHFWRMVLRSREADQLHPRAVGLALGWGLLCLLGLLAATALQAWDVARTCVLSALWGCMVVVFVTAAHRMIPFFTSHAMPFIEGRYAFWLLWLMWCAAVGEVLALWLEALAPDNHSAMQWAHALWQLGAGSALLWIARLWSLTQSLRNRMMAMLHIGFLWLGVALVLAGLARGLALIEGMPPLGLGALHALTMGCLGSLMLAMVTRVSCGHSGRAQVADAVAWSLFWLLQLATLLRMAASVPGRLSTVLLLGAALLWAAVVAVWGLRLGSWYGRLRPDGRPG
jgi:uncharacterized protein involved in response to NO